jgi:endonuclease/exonuclease/phosphatase (EEP) superfamily protein YafD
LTLAAGPTIEIISLRLAPPLVRYDLWSPSCWTEHAAIRRQHRAETEALVKALSATPAERPILIGGDCNAPAGDGALQVWNDRLHDAFIQAGRGWGCTVLNLAPVLRFDQLWCSDKLRARGVWSVKTRHSDHRLVVGDFELAPL